MRKDSQNICDNIIATMVCCEPEKATKGPNGQNDFYGFADVMTLHESA